MSIVEPSPSGFGAAMLGAWVEATGRSWWQAGYADGKVVNEWDTVPMIGRLPLPGLARMGHTSRWEEITKKGLRALRLLTPFGRVGHLEADRDYALFQFKHGGVSVGVNARGARWCDSHVIGRVVGGDGTCQLMVAEFDGPEPKLVGPLLDNVTRLKYRGIGTLNLDVLGIRL